MASLTTLNPTTARPSVASTRSGPGTVDSLSGQSPSNFSSLLAALFAAPPVIVPTQVAVATPTPGGTSAGGLATIQPTATDVVGNGLASSVASRLLASTLVTNQSAGAGGTTVQVGQALANAVNTVVSQSATLPGQKITTAGSPPLDGLSVVAGQVANLAATTLTQTTTPTPSSPGLSVTSDANQAALTALASATTTNATTTATGVSLLSGTATTASTPLKTAVKATDKFSTGDLARDLLLDAVTNQAATNLALTAPTVTSVVPQTTAPTSVPPTVGSVTAIGVPVTNAPASNLGQTILSGSFAAPGVSASRLATVSTTVTTTPAATTSPVTADVVSSATTTPAIGVPDATTASQATASLTTSLVNSGRTSVQAVLVPALSQTPPGQPSSADANPAPFFSLTGLERPADAVTDLNLLGIVGTNPGSTAVFARERSDIADLNSLLRPRAGNAVTNEPAANPQTAPGVSFGKIIDASLTPGATPAADQTGRALTQIANAIAERAQVIRDKGETEIRLRLDPPELGTIDIRVHTQKGELRAEITVADPAVRTMIESQLADLKGSLEQSGLDFQSFNLSSGHRSDRGGQPEDAGQFAGLTRATRQVPPVATQTPGSVNPNRSNRGALLDVTA